MADFLGTSMDDSLMGTGFADSLKGLAGNDTLSALGGDDLLNGGDGDDTLEGGLGNDVYFGGAGNDTALFSVLSAGYVVYRDNSDYLTIINTNTFEVDIIYNDVETIQFNDLAIDLTTTFFTVNGAGWGTAAPINGTAGADTIHGLNVVDIINGDAGNDYITGGLGNDQLNGDAGNDQIFGGDGNDNINGGDGRDRMQGDAGNDYLNGEAGNDILTGGDGDDLLEGGSGNDNISGGAGNDTAIYNTLSAGFVVYRDNSNFVRVVDTNTGDRDVVRNDVETIQFNDTTIDLTTTIFAVNGMGWGTSAVVNGTAGNDTLTGYNVVDTIFGGGGNDRILGNLGDDSLNGEDGNDQIFGGDGDDILNGGLGNDTLRGDDGNDTLNGDDGHDRLFGRAGDDIINGGAGDDFITANGGNDTIDGGAGTDVFSYQTSSIGLTIDLNSGVIADDGEGGSDTFTSIEGVYATRFDDVLTGTGDYNVIYARWGDDEVYGGAGDDSLYGEWGNDIIHGGDGADTIFGGDGDDIIYSYIPGANSLSSVILDDAPVAYWRLNETSGSTVVNYGSLGSAVDGTYQNGVTLNTSALYGSGDGSADFDGSNDRIQIPDSAAINLNSVAERTIELVFNADTTGPQQVLYEEGGTVNSLAIYIEGGQVYMEGADAGDWGPFSISGGINPNETYHVALVLDQPNGEIHGYLNGTLVGSNAVTVPLSAHSGDIGIGWSDGGAVYHDGADGTSGHYFNGQISDVAIYNSVLSEADLQERADIVANTDPIVADDGIDEISGGAGNDTIYAYGDDDIVNGDEGDDILYGTSALDDFYGDEGNDTLYGEGGDDFLDGGEGNDVIRGGTGSDTITGGEGDDTIFGDDTSSVVAEAGRLTVTQANDAQWHSVSFTSAIQNAVVKMTAEDVNGDPFTLRVRNITDNGFEFQLDEFDYQDGSTLAETISWLAVAAGSHTLENGTQIQAGFVTAQDDTPTSVAFDTAYTNPIVFSQVSSDNELSAVVTRNDNITGNGFSVNMDEEEANARTHAEEDIGWIAIEAGGSVANGLLAAETGDVVTHNTTTVNFGGTFSAAPIIIADMQTLDGGDTASGVGAAVSTTQLSVFIDEEESANAETNHTTENVGYIALNEGTYSVASVAGNDDVISGGAGVDVLYGGAGIDTFVFESGDAFLGVDTIADFSTTASDLLDLSDVLDSYDELTDAITDFVQITDDGTNSFVAVDVDGGADNFVQIATLLNVTGLIDEATLETNGVLITS